MDTLSHGLWGGLPFLKKGKNSYWSGFFFGVAPDLFSFGIFFLLNIPTFIASERHHFEGGPPDPAVIPEYVHALYNVTHSLVVFLAVFLVFWIIRKKPYWPLIAWGIHVLLDIPSHGLEFFPTPFLWPLSDTKVDGISWSHPIFIPNVIVLILLYASIIWKKRKKNS